MQSDQAYFTNALRGLSNRQHS